MFCPVLLETATLRKNKTKQKSNLVVFPAEAKMVCFHFNHLYGSTWVHTRSENREKISKGMFQIVSSVQATVQQSFTMIEAVKHHVSEANV